MRMDMDGTWTDAMFMLNRALQTVHKFGVRHGSGKAAEFSGKARSLGIQMIVEGTVCGTVFSVWWRFSHAQEKAAYDKYYAQQRAAVAAAAE